MNENNFFIIIISRKIKMWFEHTQSETNNDQAGLKFNAEEFTTNEAPLPSQLVDVNCIISA